MTSRVSSKNKVKQAKRKNGIKKQIPNGKKKTVQRNRTPGVDGISARASNPLPLRHSDTHDSKY